MRWLPLAMLVGCGGSPGTPLDAPGAAGDSAVAAGGAWTLGYYVGYAIHAQPIASIDWTAWSHLAFAPLTVQADLSLDTSFSDQDGQGPQHATELATAARAHGVTPLLMLGGAGAGANLRTAAGASHRAAFVAALLAALDTYGYAGLDLDWEDSVDLDELVALAADLRAARPTIVLSYPAGAINGNVQTVDPHMAQLAASLDRFMVQTYFPSTAVAGQGWSSWFVAPLSGVSPTTPIAADDTLARYEAAGVPHGKLGLGIGAYAICYSADITGPRQPTSGATQITGGDNDYPLSALTVPAAARHYDDATAQPYLTFAAATTDPHCGAPTRYIAYEDEQSIAAKAAWNRDHGYGGVIVWTVQELSPATTAALRGFR